MLKCFFILHFFIACCSCIYGQNKDVEKIKSSLPSLYGKSRVDRYNLISETYFNHGFFGSDAKQRIDSMYHYAKLAHKTAESIAYTNGLTAAYLNLAISHICLYQFAEAEKYVKLALSDKNISNNQSGLANNFLHAIYFEGYNKPKEALPFLKSALKHFEIAGNTKEIGNTASFLCQRYTGMGLYEEGLEYCKLSMQIFEKLSSQPSTDGWLNIQMLRSLNNMIRIYKAAGDHETALQYLHLLQKEVIKRKENYDYEMFAGELHALAGNYDSALYYLKKAPRNMFVTMQEGKVLLEQKKYKEAFPFLQSALDTFQNRAKTGRINANINYLNAVLYMSKGYFELGDLAQTRTLLQPALNEYYKYQKHMLLADRYQWVYNAYTYLQNTDSALAYLEKYNLVKDSMLTKQFLFKLNSYKKEAEDQKREAYIALLQNEHKLQEQQLVQQSLLKEQKDAEIAILEKDNKIKNQQLQQEILFKQKTNMQVELLNQENRVKSQQLHQQAFLKNVFGIGLALLMAILFFVYKFLNLQKKNEKLKNEQLVQRLKMQELEYNVKQSELQQQATALEMQALRAQMNPHFIFNSLSSINRFILKNETDEASHYLTRFSRLIRMVLIHSQNSYVPLEDEIELLKLYLDMEKLRFDNMFEYTIKVSDVEKETVFIPPLLLQPFCENAVWHGLIHKNGNGKLEVALTVNEGFLNCCITDNGIGRKKAAELKSKSVEKHKSLGLKITSDRLSLLNKDQNGAQAYIMEDVLDEKGEISGTRINLKIRYKENATSHN
jgi:hypothetical protein